jgi:hypothetical protein
MLYAGELGEVERTVEDVMVPGTDGMGETGQGRWQRGRNWNLAARGPTLNSHDGRLSSNARLLWTNATAGFIQQGA